MTEEATHALMSLNSGRNFIRVYEYVHHVNKYLI
jgi:hypothetical protein